MKWNKMKEKVSYEQAMSYGFIAVLSIVFFFSFHSSKSFSEVENRNLQTLPDVNYQKIKDKQFQQQFQDYRNDQFIMRDSWISIKTKMDLMMGKKEFNNVYLGESDQLFEKFMPSQENKEIQELLNAFVAEQKQKISLMLVPNPIEILKEKLPYGVVTKSQSEYLLELKNGLDEKMQWIDMMEPMLEHKDEYIYYRSDHHWTTLGAYYGFEQFANAKKININADDWKSSLLSNSFYGTLASKSGYNSKTADEVYAYLPTQDTLSYVVKYIEEQKKSSSVYQSENLYKNDQYSVFLNGNHPLIEIDTTSKYDKRLLIIKDSYANAMIPFILPYYSKIVIVDPRYFSADIQDLIDEDEITDILFLYNVNTFYQDTSLPLLLQE